jgi:hypothetical protein
MKITTVVSLLATAIIASPCAAQTGAQKACAVVVMTEYNKANLALLQEGLLQFSVDNVIAQRRLQEHYCLQYARCLVGEATNQALRSAQWGLFSSCLQEETKEK